MEHLLAAGVSLVSDGTLFPDMTASVRRLRDYAEVVNVHCSARDWRRRFVDRQLDRGASADELASWDALLDSWGDVIVDPLDLSCARIDVRTDDGFEPSVDRVVELLLRAPAHPRVTGGVGPSPNPVAGARGSPTTASEPST